MSTNRRTFLRVSAAAGAGLLLAPRALHAFAAPGAYGAGDRRLVLLFLEGGNDGLNTVVPCEDSLYFAARPKLAQRGANLVKLNESAALHPQLAAWREIWDAGRLAVLRGVGYERQDRSHFVSRDIWHSGRRDDATRATGWVARALMRAGGAASALPPVALGTDEAPLLLHGETHNGLTIADLDAFRVQVVETERDARQRALDAGTGVGGGTNLADRIGATASAAYATAEKLRLAIEKIPQGGGYPENDLAARLRLMARLCRAEGGPPVMWTRLGGFDTHAAQEGTHGALLGQLAGATAAFLADLARDGADGRVLVLVYSEFGRRVRENGSAGTDHGAAAPVFALGGGVRGGLIGRPPDLSALDDGDERVQSDMRAVFSEALRDWMAWPADGLFDGAFADGRARVGYLAG
jgi:uncharacterized protein (DUF1501 family)